MSLLLQTCPNHNQAQGSQTGNDGPVEFEDLFHSQAGTDRMGQGHADKADHTAQNQEDQDINDYAHGAARPTVMPPRNSAQNSAVMMYIFT